MINMVVAGDMVQSCQIVLVESCTLSSWRARSRWKICLPASLELYFAYRYLIGMRVTSEYSSAKQEADCRHLSSDGHHARVKKMEGGNKLHVSNRALRASKPRLNLDGRQHGIRA
jgi:hypothetical protein